MVNTALQRRHIMGIVAGELAPLPVSNVRNHSNYSRAQTGERDDFLRILFEPGKTLLLSDQMNGRPRHAMSDVLFALVYRSYRVASTRRFTCDLADAHKNGFIQKPLAYNTISHYLRDPNLTSILHSLITGVAASFAHIETDFAVDSTGFPVSKLTKWCDAKHGWRTRREWVKCHAMVGVKSHIVTAVEITERAIMDPSRFKVLVSDTASRFDVREVAADRAYSTVTNLEHVERIGGLSAIPFKSGTNPFRHDPKSTWSRMFHLFALNSEDYQDRLNKQCQAECTFSMIKRRFGDKTFSRDRVGQVNEVLCKVLAHNLCVVLYWLHQFGASEP